jgi:membrane fusion protein (multidrug efflux system)
MKTRRIASTAVWVLVLLTLGCGSGDQEPSFVATPVVLAPVQLRDVVDHIDASGELLAKDQADVAAEVPGRITEILVFEGDAVEAGQIVLEIDPERRKLEVEDANARVLQAEAGLVDQKREEKRVRELRRKQVASQAQLDKVNTGLKLARAQLAAARSHLGVAERALRDASVAAPFGGFLARRFVSVGEFVNVGQRLFELVALDPIEVEFSVAEKDSSRIALGSEVSVRVAPFPDESFTAVVTVVSPTIDPRTRTLRLKAQLSNPDGRLKPGLFARVDLGVDRRSGVPMVPEEAILYRSEDEVVFVVTADSRVERRVIETGVHVDGEVEVVEGLEGGESVVARGHLDLIDGELVAARNPDGSSATPQVAEGQNEAEGVE